MVKGLKNENQQPSVTQELGRLFPRTRDGGRTGESRQLLSVDAGESATDTNNTSFTTQSITKRIFEEIWGDQKQHQRNHRRLCRIKQHQEKLTVNLLFFFQWIQICYLVHVISQVWSPTTVVWSSPNKNWAILSHFSPIQKEYKDFELLLLRQTYQRNHVLNYASGSRLDT